MIALEGDFKEVVGPTKKFKIETNKGINFTLSDDRGVIMTLQCSQQPSTTVVRAVVHGNISVTTIGGVIEGINGPVTLRRV
jgi:hypothetical protein